MAGAAVVQVDADIADGYKLTADALKSVLTPKTKALIFCNPSNPTGAVVDEAGQRELLAVLDAHEAATGKKVWVISDEIYEQLHYEPATPHASFAALGSSFDRTVTINGFSKAYDGGLPPRLPRGAPGRRPGLRQDSGPDHVLRVVARAGAGVAALNLPAGALDGDVAEFKRRRDLVLAQLEAIAAKRGRIRCPPAPEGAFYVFVDVSGTLGLRKLALVPGDAFGAPDGVRISTRRPRRSSRPRSRRSRLVNDDCN
ncbi:transferase [Aureococcus anophagefferens]|nr:transferase [Aureococcus anophagefferens]